MYCNGINLHLNNTFANYADEAMSILGHEHCPGWCYCEKAGQLKEDRVFTEVFLSIHRHICNLGNSNPQQSFESARNIRKTLSSIVKTVFTNCKAPEGFWWVGIGGILIGLGGIALAFISGGKQLLVFSPQFVITILPPLLLLMTLAFTYGFVRDIKG